MSLRRVVIRTAGGVAVLGVLSVALVVVEGAIAMRRTYASADDAPPVTGSFGEGSGRPLTLAILGDSTGAGLGVTRTEDTVGARLATLLAGTGRRVELRGFAVSGSRAADLGPQVSRALLGDPPDIAVILIGANDATHRTALGRVTQDLGDAVRRLRAAGAAVIVGTCPDLGAARAFLQPLRELAAWSGRRVADAEFDAVTAAGGTPVDLAARTGPVFRADPGTLSADAFHPSADGYNLWAMALYPAVYDAAAALAPR